MNLTLIGVEDGDSSGNSRCFLHRKRSGRCMNWIPRRRAMEQRLRTPHRVVTPSWPTSCWPQEA